MMRIILVLAAFISMTGAAIAADKGKPGAFFEALYDVPVMPGLEEIPDQAMLFDKPDGRIASVVAASKTVDVQQIGQFYGEALPQLGWKKTTENQYVRGEDRLVLEITKKPPLTIVHFTLSPNKS